MQLQNGASPEGKSEMREVVRLGYEIHRTMEKVPAKITRIGKTALPERRQAFRLIQKFGPDRAADIMGDKYWSLVWDIYSSRPEVFVESDAFQA